MTTRDDSMQRGDRDRPVEPPRLARALLLRRLPVDDVEFLLGDLEEAFAERALRSGPAAARRWFWRETLHLILRPWPVPPARRLPNAPRETRMHSLLRDLRFAWRSIIRTPGTSALIVLTLALGIGAASAIFSVVHPTLLGMPPFRDPARLMLVWERERAGTPSNVGYLTFLDLRERSRTFESSAAMSYWTPIIRDGEQPERINGQRVTSEFFHALGVRPLLGRDFTAAEDRQGANRVLMLGYGLWQRHFGSDSAIVGRVVHLGDTPYTVVGVLPPTFESVLSPGSEIWAPLGYDASLPYACRSCRHLRMIARLRDGITVAAAEHELTSLMPDIEAQSPKEYDDAGVMLMGLHTYITQGATAALYSLVGAVVFVLLIACANAANLLFGRAIRRESEFAVRTALGSGRRRLLSLVAWEGVLLAAFAGVLGILIAVAGVGLLKAINPPNIPRMSQVRVDGTVLLFACLLSLVTGFGSSVLPAITAMRTDLHGLIKSGGRGISSGLRHRMRGALVVSEVALAVTLLAGAALLFASLGRLLSVDAGFDPRNRLTMQVDVSGSKYNDSEVTRRFYDDVAQAVRALPGVSAAGFTSQLPLGSDYDSYGVHLEGSTANPASDPSAFRYAVGEGYLTAIGIPLLRGRVFTADEIHRSDPVALVNRTFADRLFPGGDAIGKRFQIGGEDTPWRTIIGVVGDSHQQGLDVAGELQMYHPMGVPFMDGSMRLVVRTTGDPTSVAGAVRRAIGSVDPNVAVANVASMESLLAQSTLQRRLALNVFEAFALIALALAAAGIFGALAASVSERTREIGVRSALGAPHGRILVMIVRQGLVLTAFGLAVGLGGAYAVGKLLSGLLYGIEPHDPRVLVGTGLVLLAVAVVACLLPALRAARVDPVVALRDG